MPRRSIAQRDPSQHVKFRQGFTPGTKDIMCYYCLFYYFNEKISLYASLAGKRGFLNLLENNISRKGG